ncbi:hypothetical protein BH09BAC3_BH09BAC3_16990 [soil metagenome]
MKLIAIFAFFLSSFQFVHAQTKIPILERKVTLELINEKVPDALSRIGKEGAFSFSYNSSIISNDQLVTIRVSGRPVREILNEIFKETMEYKEKGNHLILSKVIKKQSTVISIIISGYVENSLTKERVPNASVYDKKSVTSVITDEYGYFKMRLDKKEQSASIAVSKRDFRDTLVTITAPGNQYLNISITPVGTDSLMLNAVTSSKDSIKEELILPYEDEANIQNISDTLYSDIQISLLPFLGSNGSLSGNTINNYSINMLGGYSLGTRQIELGFIINMDRGDVSWLQIAGVGNLVGGNVYGVQASGFFNVNGGETKAVQLTGFSNVNFKDFQGVQVAVSNINLKAADGVQVGAMLNLTNAPSKGVQIAGITNFQAANYIGPQIAGISNLAFKNISGSQIAAVFNYGKNVKGTQIGLFNYADSLSGAPVGLVSFVRNGYHKLEVSADEVFYTNVAFRTGAQKFYNILLAGFKPEQNINNGPVWTFGYGLGTAPKLSRSLQLNIDLTSQHVSKGEFTSELSLLNKVHLGLDYKLAKKFSIYGGVTLNGYLTNSSFRDYPVLFTGYQPSIINDHTFDNGTNLKMWFGAKIGLRFL